jgi:hypothetical protein
LCVVWMMRIAEARGINSYPLTALPTLRNRRTSSQ